MVNTINYKVQSSTIKLKLGLISIFSASQINATTNEVPELKLCMIFVLVIVSFRVP